MKLDSKLVADKTTQAQAPKQPFKALLAEAKAEIQRQPPGLLKRAVAKSTATTTASTTRSVGSPGAVAAQQTRVAARAAHELEAQRLHTVRAAGAELAQVLSEVRTDANEAVLSRSEARLIEFIVKELKGDQRSNANSTPGEPITERVTLPEPTPTTPTAALAATMEKKTDVAAPVSSADQATALIEKIELFVRSQRPGLALTLNNSLGARVEIERIGPKEIALKLVGHHGPPTADAVSRIRDELRARGLKVGALSVA